MSENTPKKAEIEENTIKTIEKAQTGILLPPLSVLRNAPFVTMFSGVVEGNILVTYPISLYTRREHMINWLGFLYCFLFTGKDNEKTGVVTYPLCFKDEYKWEIYERLLKEAEELARAFKASSLLYEGYQSIKRIIYPLSGLTFGNTCNEDFLTFVRDNQFVQKEARPCYEVVSPLQGEGDSVHAYTLSDLHERRRRYLELCSLSDSYPQLFDVRIGDQPPGIMDKIFFHKDWVIFTESGHQKGGIRWIPHLFPTENKGKIVRMLFYSATPEFVYNSVAEALNLIFSSGVTTIHISDIEEGSLLESKLKKVSSKVYETVYMVKDL